jgi:hypothetical protein
MKKSEFIAKLEGCKGSQPGSINRLCISRIGYVRR